MQRIDLVGLNAIFGDRLGHLGRRHGAFFAERLERGNDDVVAVDLEMLAQLAAEITAAKAVGAQHFVRTACGNVRTNLLGKRLHVVGRSHHRAAAAGQLLRGKRYTRCLQRVQQVPALGVLAFAGQLVEAGAAPDIGLYTPLRRKQLLRFE